MSTIQSLSTSSARQILQQHSVSSRSMSKPPFAAAHEAKLDSALAETGLSNEDRAALKTDLKAAMEEAFSSGGFPPDPSRIQSTVKSVFEKHGLDADKMASKLMPSGGAGFPGAGKLGAQQGYDSVLSLLAEDDESSSSYGAKAQENESQALLKAIDSFLTQLSEQGSTEATTDYLMTGLLGFRAEA